MKKVFFTELGTMAKKAQGKINKIYVHWSGGTHEELFDDYHINITGSGEVFISTNDFTEKREHTWQRNENAIGIALCCGKGASMDKNGKASLGKFPPTEKQVDALALLLAFFTVKLDIPLDANTVMTHAEVAEKDGYDPKMAATKEFKKWNLYKILNCDRKWNISGEVIRKKAKFYAEEL